MRGADIDRELRVVYTPAVPPGDEVEVVAMWDVRDRHGDYVIIVTADAFSQIEELRTDNNSARIQRRRCRSSRRHRRASGVWGLVVIVRDGLVTAGSPPPGGQHLG